MSVKKLSGGDVLAELVEPILGPNVEDKGRLQVYTLDDLLLSEPTEVCSLAPGEIDQILVVTKESLTHACIRNEELVQRPSVFAVEMAAIYMNNALNIVNSQTMSDPELPGFTPEMLEVLNITMEVNRKMPRAFTVGTASAWKAEQKERDTFKYMLKLWSEFLSLRKELQELAATFCLQLEAGVVQRHCSGTLQRLLGKFGNLLVLLSHGKIIKEEVVLAFLKEFKEIKAISDAVQSKLLEQGYIEEIQKQLVVLEEGCQKGGDDFKEFHYIASTIETAWRRFNEGIERMTVGFPQHEFLAFSLAKRDELGPWIAERFITDLIVYPPIPYQTPEPTRYIVRWIKDPEKNTRIPFYKAPVSFEVDVFDEVLQRINTVMGYVTKWIKDPEKVVQFADLKEIIYWRCAERAIEVIQPGWTRALDALRSARLGLVFARERLIETKDLNELEKIFFDREMEVVHRLLREFFNHLAEQRVKDDNGLYEYVLSQIEEIVKYCDEVGFSSEDFILYKSQYEALKKALP